MTHLRKSLPRKEIRLLLALSLCYILGLFLFSMHTSPLYPNLLGVDSAIFSLLGKGIVEGKTLYLDLFDHKGPFIFFIDALGYWIGGYNGIFLLQCVNGLITTCMLYFTVKLLRPAGEDLSWKMTAVIFFIGYAYFFYTFERGNLTEEYSLPFISCAMFLMCKYALRAGENPSHPPKYAFFYGVGLTALAFFRLTNAASLCAGILVVLIYLICKKEYKNLLLNLCAGLAGIAVVAAPVMLYFWSCSALDEMIYATFLHNFQIFGKTSQYTIEPQLLLIHYAPMAVCALFLVVHWLRTRKLELIDILLGAILILNTAVLWVANRYPHYFTIFVPVYFVFLARYLRPGSGKKLCAWAVAGAVLSLIGLGYYTYFKSIQSYFILGTTDTRYTTITEDFRIIPEEERDSVICYQASVDVYHFVDILPCYKYYALQETWAITNPEILDEFMDWAETEKPLWIVKGSANRNPELQRILSQYYEMKRSNDYVVFYRLKE